MNLDLTDEQAAACPGGTVSLSPSEREALISELHDIIESDRYPFSPRIRNLREILNKLRPEPKREPLPPPDITSRHAEDDTADAVSKIRSRVPR
jgi:hypothetical protein